MKIIRWYYLIVPTIVIGVIFNHFYQRNKGLSPWKGGGFGMYSDVYPGRERVFFNDINVSDSVHKNRNLRVVYHKFIFYPNQQTFDKLYQHFPSSSDSVHVVMKRILVHNESLKLYKSTSYERTFIPTK